MNPENMTIEELAELRTQMLEQSQDFITNLYEYTMAMGFKHVRYPWSQEARRFTVHRGIALYASEKYLGVVDGDMVAGKCLSVWSLRPGFKLPMRQHTIEAQDELTRSHHTQLAYCLLDQNGSVVLDREYFVGTGEWQVALASIAEQGRGEVERKWAQVNAAAKASLIKRLYPERGAK